MNRKELNRIARLEIDAWTGRNSNLPRCLVIIILFAFIHRVTAGETVEETFFGPAEPDYEI